MSEQSKDSDSIFPKDEFPTLPTDPTPKQMEAMGAIEMPSDPEEAKQQHMRLTQDFEKVYYWVPKPQGWLDRKLGSNEPPNGRDKITRQMMQCRPWDECGLVIHEPNLWEDALVILRYADHVELIMAVEDLHKGFTFHGGEIRKKFVPVHPGEKDVSGVLHKGK